MNSDDKFQFALFKFFIGLAILAVLWTAYGIIFNRPLYCKVALITGTLKDVPAFCLFDAAGQLLNR